MWILFICNGMVWGMCGKVEQVPYPTYDSCMQAVVQLEKAPVKPAQVYCRPKS